MKVHQWNGSKVDVKLYEARTTPDVYWSRRGNSFVLAECTPHIDPSHCFKVDGKKCAIISVNGRGEVRWDIFPYQIQSALRSEKAAIAAGTLPAFETYDSAETLAAARHFGLAPKVGQ